MDVINFCRFGYVLILASFFLMIWISLTGAREIDLVRYPSCYFNSLCACSKSGPDLGIVRCQNIHLPRIPETVNISKVFMLHLENNNLKVLEPYFLQSTGLYKIVISKNPLSYIPDETFLGLERSLWELDLSHNQLTRVPNRAIRYLRKLRYLNLRGNNIARISPENWRGLENSLTTLILTDNYITHLPTDSFSGLPMVETIDLRGNNLKEIDPSVFRDGMGRLSNLILADNQLSAIPYQALSFLKSLRELDLSHNKINTMQPAADVGVQNVNYNFLFNLDSLRLDYNQITMLRAASFQYFNVLNRTYLDGNPLSLVEENAFRQAKIKELYLRDCGLTEISPLAFSGLENFLEILDLSGNHISSLSDDVFQRLELLKTLSLRENTLKQLNAVQSLNGARFSLYHLDLSGNENAPVSLQELKKLRNLRILSLSRLSQPSLSADDFRDFGIDLEELHVTYGGLQTIKNNAFKYVHALKKLQLSDNVISSIESNAFVDIGDSLLTLKLTHALSSSVQNFPSDAIKILNRLEELDLSNNRLRNVPDNSFHFLRSLKKVHLQDNTIEMIHRGTFQGDIHRDLTEVYFSFNSVRNVQQHTFADLIQLEQIHLDDNRIESLERRAFMNLKSLKRLNLKGNKIATIAYETFQNLPELEDLDLAYNSISSLDFNIFDQVGSLGMFHVNMSHNKLINLVVAPSVPFEQDTVCVYCTGLGGLQNIKVLDLSFNNITSVAKQFFRPVELSLMQLYLGHNKLLNATKDLFGNMPHLQVLDLSHNSLYELDFDTFRNTKKLQWLDTSHNRISEIPNDLFRFLGNLRIVDFSHNRLRSLPDNLFRETGLERLDVSHNLLGKLPLTSLSLASAQTLSELDLSWNSISSLSHGGQLARFKCLSWLDLSYNRLGQIDAGTFKGIPRLASLNLGHNSQLTLEINGLSFQGLEYTLLHLNLDNVSLSQVPALSTPNLLSLSLAFNSLPTVALEVAGNISSLRYLNLDYNDLSAVPIVTHSLTELRHLSLEGNPITTLSNTSLLGAANQLEELNLKNIDLTVLESGAFCKMQPLRTLKIGVYRNIKNFNIPSILQFNDGLKNLEIHVTKDTDTLDNEMRGAWPLKLQNLTLSGKGLKKITGKMFQGVRSPTFHLTVRNTSIIKIPFDVFRNMLPVRNVSVDVRDNILLKNLQNPSTGSKPGKPRSAFLTDLKLMGGKWSCDCDLGWVEVWERKRRQYLCPSVASSLDFEEYNCRHTDDGLRNTLCANKNNRSLVEVLKSDIECGWSKASMEKLMIWLVVLCQIVVNFV
ncbi:chaoptin isoform X1 [Tribolium castaneum]|uniref:chaoptin isoform X1 n=1 Tax=Tribolium castaneum TaxID=7070 RepID=UPI00077DA3FB|nr:PREDICTED: chaoptin isoform X1 [Tribolium castaneum]|eukprot:XP_015839467.1 PREDICTED: chaoptin isoform X1 [Tribolium castaneum]